MYINHAIIWITVTVQKVDLYLNISITVHIIDFQKFPYFGYIHVTLCVPLSLKLKKLGEYFYMLFCLHVYIVPLFLQLMKPG